MTDSGGILGRRKRLGDKKGIDLSTPTTTAKPAAVDPKLAAKRRFTRPHELREALQQLDATTNPVARKEIADWIQEVYEAYGSSDVVGLFGHCYLGDGHIDHAFSFTGDIIAHYYPNDQVPPMYQGARPLARTDQYAYIEIYADGMIVPVRPDGTAAI